MVIGLIWFLIISVLSLLYLGAVHWLALLFFGGVAFLIAGAVGGALTVSERHARRHYMPMIGLGAILLAISTIVFMTSAAFGRDPDGRYNDSPFKAWFSQQYNSAGGWCCDLSDGHPYDGNYQINADGSVTLDLGGQPQTVEAYKVLKDPKLGPNPTGHAIVWYNQKADGSFETYCFPRVLWDNFPSILRGGKT